MKKLLIVVLCLLLCTLPVSAEEKPTEYTSGIYTYILLDDGTAEITGLEGWPAELVIPSELDGHTVTRIGDFWSKGHLIYLESVTIPDTITYIGSAAFSGASLTSVTIPDSVTEFGVQNPFSQNMNLTNIDVSPDHPALTVIDGMLISKTNNKLICFPCAYPETDVVIPDGVTRIGTAAFMCCQGIDSVAISDSVTIIGSSAFQESSLSYVFIPDSVTSIGGFAFAWCNHMAEIYVPSSVTNIGSNAFESLIDTSSHTPLLDVVVEYDSYAEQYCQENGLTYSYAYTYDDYEQEDEDKPDYDYEGDYGYILQDDGTAMITEYIGSSGVLVLPESMDGKAVTAIGDYAFYGCESLTEITLPNSVTSIGEGAFADCYNLAQITLPDNLTSIGNVAFCACDSLAEITIPDGVTSIGEWAFTECLNLTEITLPDSIETIGAGVFADCHCLERVHLPDTLTYIGEAAFENCYSLTEIALPDSVTDIGDYAFSDSEELIITVGRGSYAESYCIENDLDYSYAD